jgi:hypothetical protein
MKVKLLKYALENKKHSLAAHALVYAMVKVKVEENGKTRRPQRQSKRS